MPASAWSRMWQWNIHVPGRSSKRTAIDELGFRRHVHGVLPLRHAVCVEHLEEIAVQVERMREVRVVRDVPDLRLAELALERLRAFQNGMPLTPISTLPLLIAIVRFRLRSVAPVTSIGSMCA